MDLTDATSIVQSVTNGLLVVTGIGAAVALMLAVVRYYTNGANPNARQQLITRCIHVVGSVACIGLVLNFATPFAASLMENSVSSEIASDAKSSNSWLPQVEVNGKKYNVPNGNDVAKSKNLGEALKKAAAQQAASAGLQEGSSFKTASGGTVREMKDPTGTVTKYKCGECGKLHDTKNLATLCAEGDIAKKNNKFTEGEAELLDCGIYIYPESNSKGEVVKYRCGNCDVFFDSYDDVKSHAWNVCSVPVTPTAP